MAKLQGISVRAIFENEAEIREWVEEVRDLTSNVNRAIDTLTKKLERPPTLEISLLPDLSSG